MYIHKQVGLTDPITFNTWVINNCLINQRLSTRGHLIMCRLCTFTPDNILVNLVQRERAKPS